MYTTQLVDWTTASHPIKEIREKVFVVEQRLDWSVVEDAYDIDSLHVLTTTYQGNPIACGRIKPTGHLGRVAVLIPWRHAGVGTHLMRSLVRFATEAKFEELHLHAPLNLIDYFKRFGFTLDGPVFMEWGRPTQRMTRQLVGSPLSTPIQHQLVQTFK